MALMALMALMAGVGIATVITLSLIGFCWVVDQCTRS